MAHENISIDLRCICRCCGWSFGDYFPWGEDGESPEYVICECCGCESGNEDYCADSLVAYRQSWLNSGAKWWMSKTKPVDWDDGRLLKEQLKRVPPKKRFHKVPNYSPFVHGFKTPDAAIVAGQKVDTLRRQQLGLDLERIKGKVARKLHWSPAELALEFAADLYLVLKSKPEKIDAFIMTENIVTPHELHEEYEFIYNDKISHRWSPICVARYFTGSVFANIYFSYRLVWLYFQECPKLIEVVQFAAQESELPILTWDEGT